MALSNDDVRTWDDLIRKITRSVVRDFPDLELDDLYQSVWEDLLQDESYHYYSKAPWIKMHMYRRTKWIAWQHRKEHLQWSSQYSYRPSDIRQMLRAVFDPQDWQRLFLPGDATEENNSATRLDLATDLSWALDNLSSNYRSILESHYGHSLVFDDDSAEARMLTRAEVRLTELLNQYRGTETGRVRKKITNAHANYVIQEQNGE